MRERCALPDDYLAQVEQVLRPTPTGSPGPGSSGAGSPGAGATGVGAAGVGGGAGWPVAQTAAVPNRTEVDWSGARKSMVEAILASATPERGDRLFPGDIEQFSSGGTTLGYGAAGVLHALAVTGAGRYPEHENWLVQAVRTTPPRRPGLYDGAFGVAAVLADLGHHEPAGALVDEFTPLVADVRDHGLHGGLAGIGLALTRLADVWQRPEHLDQALAVGDRLGGALAGAAGPGASARAGLMHGWSGPALLFVHLFRRTGDRAWLDLADRALLRELQECERRDDGRLQVRDGTVRSLPYLEVGSAGIAVVAEELAEHAPDAASAAELPALRRALLAEYVAQSGLWLGRAGLISALALSLRRHPDPEGERGLATHLARLGLHAVDFRGELAFPGNQLLRLSMDLATGTAGVLLAVSAAVDDRVPPLPFLGERHVPADAPVASAP